MSEYYEKWITKEKEWIKEEKKKSRKSALVWVVGVIVVLPVISIVSGLASGAEKFWSGAPASLLIGLCIGGITWLCICCTNPAKKYEKYIRKVTTEQMSETQRDSFARQMLGEDPDSAVREVSWKDMSTGHQTARITKDYLTFADDRGNFQIVQLWKTERIELDVKDFTYRARGGNITARISEEMYPMNFFYKGSVNGDKKECDTWYTFNKRSQRDEVLQAIKEVAGDIE